LIGHGSLHWAETKVPSGLASLFIASEPIIVFLMSCAAEKRWRMNGYLLAGVVLGLAGVGLLMGREVWAAGSGAFSRSGRLPGWRDFLARGNHLFAPVASFWQPVAAVRAFVAGGFGDAAHCGNGFVSIAVFQCIACQRVHGFRWRT